MSFAAKTSPLEPRQEADPMSGHPNQKPVIPFIGIAFSGLSLEQVSEALLNDSPREASLVVTCNMDHARELSVNPDFRAAYRSASIVTMDGKPLQAYARLRAGVRVPNVTGADIFLRLFKGLDPLRHRPYFVASTHDVGSAIVGALVAKGFNRDACGYFVPPLGFERDAAGTAALIEAINKHCPSQVFLGVGAPKSEIWIWQNARHLAPAYYACFGAALEFLVGTKRRAPGWLGRLGLEWLWRLSAEPMRLSRRYARSFCFLLSLLRRKPSQIDLLNESSQ